MTALADPMRAATADGAAPLLEVRDVRAGYGFLEVLHGVGLTVRRGGVTALVGPNGAGKSTLLQAVAGLVRVRTGDVVFEGTSIRTMETQRIRKQGLALVTESLNLFPAMSIYENLLVGGYTAPSAARAAETLEFLYQLFPILKRRRDQLAGTLSGGERKMLAVGRALMGRPKLLLVDEPSLGLAPVVTDNLFEALSKLAAEDITVLLVEQNVPRAFAIAQDAYVMEQGSVVLSGTAAELSKSPRVQSAYMGV
jgi:branched-chain amino acid transport system ATP-binding protein